MCSDLQGKCSIVILNIRIKIMKESCCPPSPTCSSVHGTPLAVLHGSAQEGLIVPLTIGEAEPGRRGFPESADWRRAELGPRPGSRSPHCALSSHCLLSVPVLMSKIKDVMLKPHSLIQLYGFQCACVCMCVYVHLHDSTYFTNFNHNLICMVT